jgi:hypothetical protein
MNHTKRGKLLLMALVAGLVLLATVPLLAQTGDGSSTTLGTGPSTALRTGYGLTWSTVDGGGYTFSSGGGYTLGGTAGQPDAGLLSGGGYTLGGGFWASGGAYGIYLPLVMHHSTP